MQVKCGSPEKRWDPEAYVIVDTVETVLPLIFKTMFTDDASVVDPASQMLLVRSEAMDRRLLPTARAAPMVGVPVPATLVIGITCNYTTLHITF